MEPQSKGSRGFGAISERRGLAQMSYPFGATASYAGALRRLQRVSNVQRSEEGHVPKSPTSLMLSSASSLTDLGAPLTDFGGAEQTLVRSSLDAGTAKVRWTASAFAATFAA